MGRISRSFELMKKSWSVIRQDKELVLYPVISGLCALVISAIFIVPIVVTMMATGDVHASSVENRLPIWAYPVLFVMYCVLAFVQFFFNAALVGAAAIRLDGGDPSFGDGIRIASKHAGSILGWAVIAATVGMILRAVQERAGFVGKIVVGLIGVAWNLITFFVVPVLVFEDAGPVEAIKRSATIFKERWGETFVGVGGIGLAVFVVMLPGILLIGLGAFLVAGTSVAAGIGVIALGFLWMVGVSIVGSAMQQVYNCALYRFATQGSASGAFTADEMYATFQPGRRR